MSSSRPFSAWPIAFLIGAALWAAGCSGPPSRPDLKRLYQSANVVIEQPPLILIPGVMGSRLRDKTTHQEVWPGGLWRIAFHHYEELALEIDPSSLEGRPNNIEAFALTDKTAGEHFYDTITQTLTDSGSFELTTPGTPIKDPFTGSANTIENMVDGVKLFIERIRPQTLATLPSAYQLLPNSDRKPLVGLDGRPLRVDENDGASPERDIFDVNTWRDLKWSVFNPELEAQLGPARTEILQKYFAKHLARAGNLQRDLERQQPASPVKLIVFGADCILTPSRVLVESQNGRMVPYFDPQKIKNPLPDHSYDELMSEPGDGEVTKASILGRQSLDPTVQNHGGFPIAFSFFLCAEHSDIPGNINFQDNLLNAILSR